MHGTFKHKMTLHAGAFQCVIGYATSLYLVMNRKKMSRYDTQQQMIILITFNTFHTERFDRRAALADLGGGVRDARPPWASKFFRFHAVLGKIWRVHAPPGGFTPPPRENPGSATVQDNLREAITAGIIVRVTKCFPLKVQ